MKVYFIRHGQSMTNMQKRCGGWTQCPLSDLGLKQARSLAPVLAGIHFDRIYSSDLLRTVQTAKNAIVGCEPEQRWELREIHVGILQDGLRTELAQQYGEAFTNAGKSHDYTPFGGENESMIKDRVHAFMRELESLDAENIAVVGSEGTIHHMLTYVLRTDFDIHNLRIRNCSISVLSFEDCRWRLEQFAYTPELV